MERLKISENRRYFETESGKPFIWIADTDWTMPQRMKWDDAEYFMKKRKSQGFTVLQIVALDPERDVEMRNPAGEKALIDNDILKPNENYFRYLDWILDKAEENGLYVLLLPVWGQLVVGEDWSGGTYEKTVTVDNAYAYGKWIGARYGNRKNIIWCLGGDRQPIHRLKYDYRDVWRRMAEGLLKGVTGNDAAYNEKCDAWKELLITYHACNEQETGECSTFSYWTDEEAWISFIMLQSGHGKFVKNYDLVKKEYDREITMPVWDGEPAYEAMPTCWPITDENAFHKASIVPKRAFWSLLAGAFGYTYGHCNVWCSISEREKNIVSRTDWFEALSSTASGYIRYLHSAMASLQLYNVTPCQEVLLEKNQSEDVLEQHISAAYVKGGSAMALYFPAGGTQTVDVSGLQTEESLNGWWYCPENGTYYTVQKEETDQPVAYAVSDEKVVVTAPDAAEDHDWLLILTKDSTAPIENLVFGEEEKEGEIKKVFEW